MRFLKAIRYSAIGVFFTGIIGVIQGCSVEREGALFAALLFLLSFCSGPADTGSTPVSTTFTVDPFTTDSTLTSNCNAFGTDGTDFSDASILSQISVTAFNRQFISQNPLSTGNSPVTYSATGGTLTITVGAGSGCDWNVHTAVGYALRQATPVLDGAYDLSAFSELELPIISTTGTVTGCTFGTYSATGGAGGIISALNNFTPVAGTDVIIDISAAANNAVVRIALNGCNFSANSSLTVGPISVK